MRSLIFLILVCNTSPGFCQAVIRGIIESEQPVSVSLFNPYESRYYNHSTVTKSLVVNSHDTFTLQVEVKNPVIVKIVLDSEPVYVWTAPNDTISFKASVFGTTVPKDFAWVRFQHANSTGQWLFNQIYSYPYPMSKYFPVQDLLKEDLVYSDVKKALAKIIMRATYPFDSLYEKNEISAQFRDGIKTNLRALLLKEFLKPFERGNSKILNRWGVSRDSVYALAFQLQNPDDKALLQGVLSHQFAESKLYFKAFKEEKANSIGELKDSILNRGGVQLKLSKTFTKYLQATPDQQEYLWGNMLLSVAELFPTAISHDDLLIFDSYFPASFYSSILEKKYPSIAGKRNTVVNENYPPANIHYVAPEINDLNSLFKKALNGKRLYVDIWATWCVPCRKEFKYYGAIDTFLIAHNIEKLFISIDNSANKNLWKQTVETYDLSGNHLLVSKELYEDIKKLVFKNVDFTIPKYLIVDEKGDILSFDAERPSSASKLQAQFKQLFKLK